MSKNMIKLQIRYEERCLETVIESVGPKNYSELWIQVNKFVFETEALIYGEEPWWWHKDLYEERKLQIKLLKQSLSNAYLSQNDDKLRRDIRFIKKHCTVSSYLPSIYNKFKDQLQTILDSKLKMNQPPMTKFVQQLEARLRSLESEQNQHVIRETKLEYSRRLESNSLRLIEQGLKTISGDEMLQELVQGIRMKVSDQLKIIHTYYLNQVSALDQQNKQAFADHVEKLGELTMARKMLAQVKTQHPGIWSELVGSYFPNDARLLQTSSTLLGKTSLRARPPTTEPPECCYFYAGSASNGL